MYIFINEQHKIERPKKDSVISKHRKWLADLQKQKDMLETQYINEISDKKEAQMKVQKYMCMYIYTYINIYIYIYKFTYSIDEGMEVVPISIHL
jgi:predicted  nucleic acid-binding Zn ribbon protein